ncbi:hypothetical protein [Flavisphingomonas formosensis]|uniref:hypothetical protein n=1 Tax=Flavisphingomonas formosensis TaxID=861534 RepID=UPI0012FA997D|nr:hypothetical protein [Sphingomonas formosensis]
MRALILLALPALAMVAACGKAKLSLPDDSVDRAATCAAVNATAARAGTTNVSAPLTLEQQGNALHYAMLAGAETPEFAQDKAAAVVKRMGEVADSVTAGKWQGLVQPCAEAYPATRIQDPKLPTDALQAELGCFMLADFLNGAMARQPAYSEELSTYFQLKGKLDPKIASLMAKRGIHSPEAKQSEQRKALSEVVKLGPPVPVLKACAANYG